MKGWSGSSKLAVLLSLSLGSVASAKGTKAVGTAKSPRPFRLPSSEGAARVVDPRDPGPDVPPAGRSLFDQLFVTTGADGQPAYDLPYPFSEFLKKLGTRATYKGVLIPMGRSLQRSASAPDRYFQIPRVVVAADGEVSSTDAQSQGWALRDRFYVGFHEKAGVMEVISYNELAGRFEFQVVRDYRAGAKPQVFHASRSLCITCHQGLSPIFSRQPWEETNGAANVAAKIREAMPGLESYQSIPLTLGLSVPYEIDNSTDRANFLSFYQKFWREGCGVARAHGLSPARCRATLLKLALQYRLSGEDQFDAGSAEAKEVLGKVLEAARADLWAQGLAIPNSDVPNRDPFAAHEGPTFSFNDLPSEEAVKATLADALKNSGIPAEFEPLNPRPPLEILRINPADPSFFNRVVVGVGSFFTSEDLKFLDRRLDELAPNSETKTYSATCALRAGPGDAASRRLYVDCKNDAADAAAVRFEGSFKVRAGAVKDSTLARVAFRDAGETCRFDSPASPAELVAGPPMCGDAHGVSVTGTVGEGEIQLTPRHLTSGLRSRRLNGDALTSVRVTWEGGEAFQNAKAEVRVRRDFARLAETFDRLVVAAEGDVTASLADAPFRRAAVLTALERDWGGPERKVSAGPERFPDIPVEKTADLGGLVGDTTAGEQALVARCASCHGADRSPPANFLHLPEGTALKSRLADCAERIAYRVAMWEQPASERKKTPMPPLPTLGMKEAAWKSSAEYKSLRVYLKQLLQEKGKTEADVLATNFEELPKCVP